MKSLITICSLFAFVFARSQDARTKKIDSLLDKTWEYHTKANLYGTIETGMRALNLAKEIKYDKGIAEGHFMVGDALNNIGLYREALYHFDAMVETKYAKDRIVFQSEAHRLKGIAYMKMKLYELCLAEFAKQVNLLPQLDASVRKRSEFYAYSNLVFAYKQMGKADSIKKYILLSWDLLNQLKEKESYLDRVQVLEDLAYLSIQAGDFEMAQQHLDQSMVLVKKFKVPIYFNNLIKYAELEEKRGNYAKAADYYNQALVNTTQVGDKDALRDQYKVLATFYRDHKLGDVQANEYLLKYNSLNDSLMDKNQQVIDLAKNNNGEFLTLFTELYPKFVDSLTIINPKIRSSELEFCAMAFLNFSTKDIATYTSVTVRAVQIRRNRLRKKFEIPSAIDFNHWMRAQPQFAPNAAL